MRTQHNKITTQYGLNYKQYGPRPKIVSEYNQEIPQSQTVQTHGTARKSHTTITRHQEDKLSKATSYLFPIKMIAKLEGT